MHRVTVDNLPAWLNIPQLLGPGAWELTTRDGWVRAEAELPRPQAADLGARLRNLGIGGRKLRVACIPKLPRGAVRAARTQDARRRRQTSVGFSRSGVRLDEQGRFSLTPEQLALALGKRANGVHVVDAGCGAGGNSIGFARAGCRVTAIEADPKRAADARHNTRCYDVDQAVEVLTGEVEALLPTISTDPQRDILFVDPPWGRGYNRERVALTDFPLLATCLAARHQFAEIWAKLPPSTDVHACEAAVEAVFGHAPGDARRVKFLLLTFHA